MARTLPQTAAPSHYPRTLPTAAGMIQGQGLCFERPCTGGLRMAGRWPVVCGPALPVCHAQPGRCASHSSRIQSIMTRTRAMDRASSRKASQ